MKENKILFVGLMLPVLMNGGGAAGKEPEKPNVIIIYADDIGYGDFSCNGATRVQTPNVDRLAASGLRFTNMHAVASTSTPSRYALLTGEYSWRREGTGIAAGNAALVIPQQRYTIAGMFKDNGYVTAAVGKWHLGLGEKTGEQDWNERVAPGPKELGFDYSYIMAATADRVPCVYMENQRVCGLDPDDPLEVNYKQNFPGEPTGRENPELLYKMKPSNGHAQSIVNGISRIGYMRGGKSALWQDETLADSITAKAVRFIERNRERPFFLYFATNDIHVPRVPHPRFVGSTAMGPRGDAIVEFDWSVGQIVETLERLGLRENTLILLSSDNGPVVDDGYQDRAVELLGDHKPWGPFRGGKYSSFEAGTRIPCIVSWPERVKAGLVSDALMSQIDWFASLGALTGASLPQGAAPDSRDLSEALLGKDRQGRDYMITASSALSIIAGEWKYIEPHGGVPYMKWTRTETGNSPEPQLYNLKRDCNEQKNLARQYPEKVNRLKKWLEQEKAKGFRQALK